MCLSGISFEVVIFIVSCYILQGARYLILCFICFRSNPSSIYCMRLRVVPQHNLPGLKPACSGMISSSIVSEIHSRNILSRTLKRWHSKEPGLKFPPPVGSQPWFQKDNHFRLPQSFWKLYCEDSYSSFELPVYSFGYKTFNLLLPNFVQTSYYYCDHRSR